MNPASVPLDIAQIEQLMRHTPHGLSSFIETIKTDVPVQGTKTTGYCHLIQRESGGKIRVEDLASFLAGMVLDYAIPRSEITEAKKKDTEGNVNFHVVELVEKARALFTHIETSGEGGEILLYLLIQELLKAPQFLCKMPLKTNANVHYHGIDGIHIACGTDDEGNKVPVFYWGESKVHKDISGALKDGIKTLSHFLSKNQSGDAKERDLHLMRDNIDLENEELENVILQYLDKKNPLHNKAIYKGACLIGFDREEYNSHSHVDLKKLCETEIDKWHEQVEKHLKETELTEAELHIFFLPFPSVEDFRSAFLKALRIRL